MPASSAPAGSTVGPVDARSLADDIRARSDSQLQRLLLLRPDLARPAPTDLTALAARASTRVSAQRALESLDVAHLHALEAVSVASSGEQVAALLAPTGEALADGPLVTGLVQDLWDAALVWRSGERLHVVRIVGELLGPVAGLGPPLRDLLPGRPSTPDAAGLARRLAQVGNEGRAILDRLTWGPASAVVPADGPMARAADGLVEADLLVRGEDRHVILPREVALHLRDGRLHRDSSLLPPEAEGRTHEMSTVDEVAGGSAAELLTQVDELAEAWGSDPPRVLRGGGLSVRDLGLVGAALDIEADRAAFLVELVHAAGLLADDESIDPVFAPTPAYDDWQQQPAAVRWVRLARAWLETHRHPALVGTHGRRGTGRVNALSEGTVWPPGRRLRREVLTELRLLPAGLAPDHGSLGSRLQWRHPLRRAESGSGVEVVLRESEWVGVTGRGALGGAGRALLAGSGDEAERLMAEHLPTATEHVLLQADLTAIAPGRLDGSLNRFMRTAAEVESRGGATVFRFSTDSLRRILDAGWTADQVLQTLRDASSTDVPQPLEYLVGDVARRHGRTRIGSASCYVRSDDTTVLDAMLVDRSLAPLQLRRIAPTVLVGSASPSTTTDLLRDHGYAPAVETPDGGLVVPERARHRTPPRRAASPVRTTTVDEEYAESLVGALRAGEEAAAYRRSREEEQPGPRLPASDPAVTLALLRDAAADRQGVWIGHADAAGQVQRMLFYPRRVEGGRAYGQVAGGAERSFSVHRITGAAPT
ncbi:MAG TPA: helicase-associated domain-containing protein [Segeticoccus sp.]|uniref:helicase-associated domain-containing protein n=1 Tax=Segeticoccus sp. TaxID=2706531 RepID=UPI002D80CFCB|nr:helicase-associated domain-containing protein [Segeticoccus sp.]HET8600543.1 helicase-associated domain-containing protein [Segeticoccus sp.]